MKSILTFLILFPLTILGQSKLDGKYCFEPGFVGWCIEFKMDSFSYKSWTCAGGINGKGIYTINNKKLMLHFYDTTTSYLIKERNCNSTDSVSLYFQLTDGRDNEPLSFASIDIILSKKDTLKIKVDLNGIAKMKVKKANNEYIVQASLIGNSSCSFKILPNNCKDIYIKLGSYWTIKNGVEWKYKIVQKDSNCLTLKKDRHKTILKKEK